MRSPQAALPPTLLSPLSPTMVHFITSVMVKMKYASDDWLLTGFAHIEYSISVISSNIIIFLHTHGLISIIVCGATQIGGKDRVNKEMSMIIKTEINNTLFITPSFCFASDSFILECFIGTVRFSAHCWESYTVAQHNTEQPGQKKYLGEIIL